MHSFIDLTIHMEPLFIHLSTDPQIYHRYPFIYHLYSSTHTPSQEVNDSTVYPLIYSYTICISYAFIHPLIYSSYHTNQAKKSLTTPFISSILYHMDDFIHPIIHSSLHLSFSPSIIHPLIYKLYIFIHSLYINVKLRFN